MTFKVLRITTILMQYLLILTLTRMKNTITLMKEEMEKRVNHKERDGDNSEGDSKQQDVNKTQYKMNDILFYFILFYFILFYFILFYCILFYFILFYFILFYFILFYFIFEENRYSLLILTIPAELLEKNYTCIFVYFILLTYLTIPIHLPAVCN